MLLSNGGNDAAVHLQILDGMSSTLYRREKMTITRATIVRGNGADKIILDTDLPCATWPYEGYQSVSFECAASHGEKYLAKHFASIPSTVIRLDGVPWLAD